MRDLPRIFGGRKGLKKDKPLPFGVAPSREDLVQLGSFSRRRRPKHSLSTKAVKVTRESVPVCVRRYLEYQGVKSSIPYEGMPPNLIAGPRMVFEVEGVASFTDMREALANSKVMGQSKIVIYQM